MLLTITIEKTNHKEPKEYLSEILEEYNITPIKIEKTEMDFIYYFDTDKLVIFALTHMLFMVGLFHETCDYILHNDPYPQKQND